MSIESRTAASEIQRELFHDPGDRDTVSREEVRVELELSLHRLREGTEDPPPWLNREAAIKETELSLAALASGPASSLDGII